MPIATPDTYVGRPGRPIYIGKADPTTLGGVQITTLSLKNESTSVQPANFVTKMFGLPLRQGDVPAGEYPQFALEDETPCPASFGKYPARWPDGSMRHVSVLMRVPVSIAGSATLTVKVKNGGSAPVSSALSAAGVATASDVKVSLNAVKNWAAGEWVSGLNKGIADGDVWEFMDGPAGRVMRVYEAFRQGGADHAQAGVWHYVQALQNAAGGLYGLRYLGKFANGWHDVSTPQINTLVADSVALKNGTTTVRNIAPLAAARSVIRSTPGLSTDTGNSLATGMAVTFTTTGALPGGLSTAVTYYVRIVVYGFVTLHLSAGDASTGANPVDITSAGSGTNTMVPSGAASRAVSWLTPLSATDVTGLVSGMAVRFSTTGVLPTGLTSDTAYFVRLLGSNLFTLHQAVQDIAYAYLPVAVTSVGSGVHTLTPAVQLEFYAAAPYTAGVTGEFDFLQAGGTGTECTVTVTVDRAYRKASKLFGPIRTDISPTPVADIDYNIDTFDLYLAQNGTGERPDIGYITGWCTRHFVTGTGLRTIRTHTYQQGSRSWSLRRAATKAPLNLTDDTYAPLGAAMPSFRFYPGNTAANSGVNNPADWGRMRGAHDWSHQPQMAAYAYLVTGEPQFLDVTHDMAVAALASSASRTPTVGGTLYSSIVLRDGQARVEAWTIRDIAFAAMLTPDDYMGAPLGTYFRNVLAENFDYLKAEKATGSTFAQANKFYPTVSNQYASWQHAYLLTAVNLAYTVTADPDAKLAAEDIIENYNAIRVNKALHAVSNYYTIIVGGAKQVTGWDNVVFMGALDSVSFDAATNVFTLVPNPNWGTPANGDLVVGGDYPPTGISTGTRYFMRDVSGNTCKLTATLGGPAIDIGSSGSVGGESWGAFMANASNTTMASSGYDKGYAEMIVGGTRWAKALGFTIPSGFETAIEGVYGAGPSFTNDPVYALSASFS